MILADLENLPQVALGWLNLVPTYTPLPEFDFTLTSGDPASRMLSSAIADWPTINLDRFVQLGTKANEFITAVLGTVPTMGNGDQAGANGISGVTDPP